MPWYVYNPVDSFPHNPCSPNNYVLIGTTPPSCPAPNNFLCAIQASDNMGSPIITAALCQEIALALQNRIDTTNVLLRS
ncbi:hypothetical protein HCX49_12590 [Sphingobacterium kitahiroshimense]|uniref:hypothetical protein n=1 Tax=Sphingobacterium sp. B16(2022) TaxID=2914044 RepID=UPI00143A9D6C|nr:hypothetical protein [Sphingobacterium sp. B16(2022)]NJI74041.1 hypothetical protein [Sphingobacterium sp. B16(2022)]